MGDVVPSMLCKADMVTTLASRVENQIFAAIINATVKGRNSTLFEVEPSDVKSSNVKKYIKLLTALGYHVHYVEVGNGDYLLIRWDIYNVEG